MTVPLPAELRTVLASHPGEPLVLIDEQNDAAYVLLAVDEFHRLTNGSRHELEDTFAAQVESAMYAGWDDPRMDAYNDYEAHREQSLDTRASKRSIIA
jgi:hypothetical protein